jgi:hypothetical protein
MPAMRKRQEILETWLIALVRSSPVSMRAFRAARAVDPPDWLICAGAIRDRVWDHLHRFAPASVSRDLNPVCFDLLSLRARGSEPYGEKCPSAGRMPAEL